jgi:hypothetical protein
VGNTTQHCSHTPSDLELDQILLSHHKQKNLQQTQRSDIDMCWKDLPEELSPFEQDVGNVEDLEDPDPIGITEVEVFHNASSSCITYVASIKV